MQLSRFPRAKLLHGPTPVEAMPNLSRFLGGPQIFIKRDDCTWLGGGGNKVRKLEFLLGEALATGADCVITTGALQSNHARQTAAAAAKLGLKCHLLLGHRVPIETAAYRQSGNLLLDHLFGASVNVLDAAEDIDRHLQDRAETLYLEGWSPYLIPLGGSSKVGALGYVACAAEILAQANELGLNFEYLVHASSSAGTQAGLALGLHALSSGIKVLGVSVGARRDEQEEAVYRLACETAQHMMIGTPPRESVAVDGGYVGPAYGIATTETIEAIRLAATLEGVLLDPVYSGKAMAALIGSIRAGSFGESDTILFLHTGGSQSLFAYADHFAPEQNLG